MPVVRFLIICSFAESLLNFRRELIFSLLEKGLEVHVAGPDLGASSDVRKTLESKGVVVHDIYLKRTGRGIFDDLRALGALIGLMRGVRPRYVLTYTIKPVVYGSIAAWLARVPHRFALITGLGAAFQEGRKFGLLQLLSRVLYGVSLRTVEKVFFQNKDDESLFRKSGIVSRQARTVVVNGSGVNLESFSVSPVAVGAVRFLLIARLLKDKGVREYVEAAKRIRRVHPQVVFSLVGWLDSNPGSISVSELDTWVEAGDIDFLGRLVDVRPAISDCTVYVLPSYREGTPRTVLEAMAMGRAIITTDAPGCRETVLDGLNGFLVPVKSVDKLEQAMLSFVLDATLAARMGVLSRQIAEEKFDVCKVNFLMLDEMGIS